MFEDRIENSEYKQQLAKILSEDLKLDKTKIQ
jgi:hypothetical protein